MKPTSLNSAIFIEATLHQKLVFDAHIWLGRGILGSGQELRALCTLKILIFDLFYQAVETNLSDKLGVFNEETK